MVMGHLSWETLAHEAQELLEQELDRRAAREPDTSTGARPANGGAVTASGSARWPVDVASVGAEAPPRVDAFSHSLMSELGRLLAEHHGRSAEELASAVRELIAERQFVGAAGDPVPVASAGEPQRAPRGAPECEQLVRDWLAVALRAHRQLRQRARPNGAWADVPTPPQMFG